MGNRTLCNACGLLYAKQKRKKAKETASATGQKNSATGMEETEEEKVAALEELRAAVQAKSASMATAAMPYLAGANAYGPPASSLIDIGQHMQRALPPLPTGAAASMSDSYVSPLTHSPGRFFPPPSQQPRFFDSSASEVGDRQGGTGNTMHATRPSLPPLATFFQPADPSRLDAPLPLLPHERAGSSASTLGPPPPPPFHRSHSATAAQTNSPAVQSAPTFAPLHHTHSVGASSLGLASPTNAASRLSLQRSNAHTPTPPSSSSTTLMKNRASQFFDKLNPLHHFHRGDAPSASSTAAHANSHASFSPSSTSLHQTNNKHTNPYSQTADTSHTRPSAVAPAFEHERPSSSNHADGGAGLPPPAIWASRRQL